MLNLPPDFILFDSEFTAWEGSNERNWSKPGEYKEIIQIGAIKVRNADLTEYDSLSMFVKPKFNPTLSAYIVNLTGITQSMVETEGIDFPIAIVAFKKWCGELPIYSFGGDGNVVAGNCNLHRITNPFPASQFHNIRGFFMENGVPPEGYSSGTIVTAFGEEPARRGHDAVNDARSVLDALVLLNEKLVS